MKVSTRAQNVPSLLRHVPAASGAQTFGLGPVVEVVGADVDVVVPAVVEVVGPEVVVVDWSGAVVDVVDVEVVVGLVVVVGACVVVVVVDADVVDGDEVTEDAG